MIDHRQQYPDNLPRANIEHAPPLPREYALLKLLFLPRPLVQEWDSQRERSTWRMARVVTGPDGKKKREEGIHVRPEPRILPLLRAGRVAEACRIATERLRSSGFTPLAGSTRAGSWRQSDWECDPSHDAHRLAAALLLPISQWAVNELVHLVTRQEEEPDSANLVTEGADVS